MLQYIIPLIGSYFSAAMADFWWYKFLALCFLVTVPVIIRDIWLRRSHV